MKLKGKLEQIKKFLETSALAWYDNGFSFEGVHLLSKIHLVEGYTLQEAKDFKLFQNPRRLEHFLPEKLFRRIQVSLNPYLYCSLAMDKLIFNRICRGSDLDTPTVFCAINRSGVELEGQNLPPEQKMKVLNQQLPTEFIVKPSVALYGHGISICRRQDDLYCFGQQKLTLETLIKHWQDELKISSSQFETGLYPLLSEHKMLLLQERLDNHAKIIELTGATGLQTLRLITLVAMSGEVQMIHAAFKIIGGNSITDNFLDGSTGNLAALVSIHDGKIEHVLGRDRKGDMKPVKEHPMTGLSFNSFEIPHWQEAVNLVKKAAEKFLPLRTIGWDVGLTPRGAYLVEANPFWDPSPNVLGDMRQVRPQLLKEFNSSHIDIRHPEYE